MYIDKNNAANMAVHNAPLAREKIRENNNSSRRWFTGPFVLLVVMVGAFVLAGCPTDPTDPTYPYICSNGMPAAGTSATAGTERCTSCNADYRLLSTERCAPHGLAIAVGTGNTFYNGENSPSALAAIGETLYMVGNGNDWLYTVDTVTGVATRVGSSDAFGVGETQPTGLAAIGETLYMVGSTTDRLYTLDTATGAATRVGSANRFGTTNINAPVGLAAIGETLYMVEQTTRPTLYTLNTTTGKGTSVNVITTSVGGVIGYLSASNGLASIGNTLYLFDDFDDVFFTVDTNGNATKVGTLSSFGVGEGQGVGLAAIANTLYMVGDTHDRLYMVDTGTGLATVVSASITITAFTVGANDEYIPNDLAAIGDTLYMVGGGDDALYTVDTTTGGAVRVGSANQFGVNEFNPTGLAAIGNTLYMVGDFNDRLYTVDITSGRATQVTLNSPSLVRFGTSINEDFPAGLAAIGSTLYMVGSTNDWLYMVDTTTGAAMRVGSANRFGVGEGSPTGLTAIGGSTLYMVGGDNDALYTVDTTTGVATQVGEQMQFGVDEANPLGLGAIGDTLYLAGRSTGLYTLVLPLP